MFRCKRCKAMLFEDEVFYEEDGSAFMQLGCIACPVKLYIPLREWNSFKRKIERNLNRIRERNGSSNEVKA